MVTEQQERCDVGAVPSLLIKCPACRDLLVRKDWERRQKVCQCGYHFRLSAAERIPLLVDHFEEFEGPRSLADPLTFESATGTYREKLREARVRTGSDEAVRIGIGYLDGWPLAIGVMEFGFIGGSMGTVVGEKIVRIVEVSQSCRYPLLLVSASGGARMQEGVFSLMQMARVAAALASLCEAGVPYVSLLCDPTTGGVAASFAALGQVILAEPGALISFAGPRVIEQCSHQAFPPGANTAEQALACGMIDAIVPRGKLKTRLSLLLRLYRGIPARRFAICRDRCTLLPSMGGRVSIT